MSFVGKGFPYRDNPKHAFCEVAPPARGRAASLQLRGRTKETGGINRKDLKARFLREIMVRKQTKRGRKIIESTGVWLRGANLKGETETGRIGLDGNPVAGLWGELLQCHQAKRGGV